MVKRKTNSRSNVGSKRFCVEKYGGITEELIDKSNQFVYLDLDQVQPKSSNIDEYFQIGQLKFELQINSSIGENFKTDLVKSFILLANDECFSVILYGDEIRWFELKLIRPDDNSGKTNIELNYSNTQRLFNIINSKQRSTIRCQLEHVSSYFLNINFLLPREFIITDYETFCDASLNSKVDTLFLMALFYNYENVHKFGDKSKTNAQKNTMSLDEFFSILYSTQEKKDYHLDGITLSEMDSLVPNLRPYQELAVKWMLKREKHNKLNQEYEKLFFKHSFSDIDVYYHWISGNFVTFETYRNYIDNIPISKGGILADEMGLGKTVETFALILQNQKKEVKNLYDKYELFTQTDDIQNGILKCYCGGNKDFHGKSINDMDIETLINTYRKQNYYLTNDLNNDLIKCLQCGDYQHLKCSKYDTMEDKFPYFCSRCWLKVDKIDSGTTLIVCPALIKQQWLDEIDKHLKDIKVYIYNGIKKDGYIHPPNLAKYDIVITTYDILRTEIDHVIAYDFNFRKQRRYICQLSPMLAIKWWRVCMDEAQLVETTYSRVAQMTNYLYSEHRWAITGTPLQKSVDDLHGLFYFIREEPFCNNNTWKAALYNKYCSGDVQPLVEAVSNCLWRTPKNNVLSQIGIENIIINTSILQFSQIEFDFYLRQVDACRSSVEKILGRLPKDTKLMDLASGTYSTIFSIAIKLRKICCHPVVCLNDQSAVKQYCSLQDVLDKMIEDNKYDCEKHHREIIAALNGTASLYIQKNDFNSSIVTYMKALKSINHYEEYVRTDKTQKYHIYYNLAEIVELFGCPQVDINNKKFAAFNGTLLSSSDLDEEVIRNFNMEFTDEHKMFRLKAKEIYDQYILNDKLAAITTERYRIDLVKKCNEIEKSFKFEGNWFSSALFEFQNVLRSDEVEMLIEQISEYIRLPNFVGRHTLKTVHMILDKQRAEMNESRLKMISSFFELHKIIDSDDVSAFMKCHIQRNSKKDICILCIAQNECNKYEEKLFNVQYRNQLFSQDVDVNNANDNIQLIRDGNWNESNYILALRKIGQLYRSKFQTDVSNEVVSDYDKFCQLIEELKKEFKTHRKYLTNLYEFILRKDELNQAQTRLVSTLDEDQLSDQSTIEFSKEMKIIQHMTQFNNEKNYGEQKLVNDLSRLKYLSQLKTKLKDKDDVESRICSICWTDLIEYIVLPCGHFYCIGCMEQIQKYHGKNSVQCSVCRTRSSKNTWCHINEKYANEAKLKVNGSWSTKVVHVVRCILKILESKEKILLFSSWTSVLSLIQKALDKNNIKSVMIHSASDKFVSKIKRFKSSSEDNVLLLPTNFACNGLNLIEASHVIFVNSSLNKADELQAIGRIHRIGQTRQTFVHKFIVKDTVEEMIENHHKNIFYRPDNNRNNELSKFTIEEFLNLYFV